MFICCLMIPLIVTAVLTIVVFCPFVAVHSARILAFLPIDFKSHHNVFQPILHELALRGHEIVYFSPFNMSRSHPNVTVIQSINTCGMVVEKFGERIFGKLSTLESAYIFGEIGLFTAEKILSLPITQQLIHSSERFDLILHEAFFGQDYVSAFQYKFDAPGVMLVPCADSSWANEISSLKDNPSYMADYRVPFTDRMTFTERLYSAYVTTVTVAAAYFYQWRAQSIVDEHFQYPGGVWESRPSLTSLVFDQSLVLVNSHHALSFPFPKAPHVKQIGGVNIVDSQPLPKDIENFINNAKHGVIYFSFGSVINPNMVGALRIAFSQSFSRIPQNVLWKWDIEPWDDVPDNVMLSNWFPQQDILAHSNVKLFITHGGLLSLFEAVYNAVPMVVVPFFADQERNSRFVATVGLGVCLDLDNITETSISWALNEVMLEKKYENEAIKRSKMLEERPMQPLEEAAYWIEYVLKFGRALQPASVRLSFFQYHLIDVWIFLVFISVAIFCSGYYGARKIVALLHCRWRLENYDEKTRKQD